MIRMIREIAFFFPASWLRINCKLLSRWDVVSMDDDIWWSSCCKMITVILFHDKEHTWMMIWSMSRIASNYVYEVFKWSTTGCWRLLFNVLLTFMDVIYEFRRSLLFPFRRRWSVYVRLFRSCFRVFSSSCYFYVLLRHREDQTELQITSWADFTIRYWVMMNRWDECHGWSVDKLKSYWRTICFQLVRNNWVSRKTLDEGCICENFEFWFDVVWSK